MVENDELKNMLREIENAVKKYTGNDVEAKVIWEKYSDNKLLSIRITGVSDLKIYFQSPDG